MVNKNSLQMTFALSVNAHPHYLRSILSIDTVWNMPNVVYLLWCFQIGKRTLKKKIKQKHNM